MNRFKIYSKMWFLVLLLVTFVAGCAKNADQPQPSDKAITSYSINGVAGVIIEGTTPKTISVILPYVSGTAVTALTATYTTTGRTVKVGTVLQSSGTTPTNDFTSPVVYTVTAADGSTANYTVTVTMASITDKAITSYSLNGVIGVISEATTPKTITVVMPAGTDLTTAKTATWLTTGVSVMVAGVTQVSGTAPTNVFTQGTPKVYTVTAADGSTAAYNVNVSTSSVSEKAIISYSLDGIAGIISEATTPKTISVIMPYGTDMTTAKTATWLTTGTNVAIAGVTQNSALVPKNVFTQGTPKIYTVTAADGTTATYNVNVSVATSSAKAITSYSLNGIAGVISESTTPKTITVVMPYGTDMTTAKTATWLTTGTGVTIGGVMQISGLPPTNVFTQGTPKVYTVTAADASTAAYNVNVSVASNSDKAITSYSLDGIAGVISESTTPKTITVVMPSGTDLTTAKTATWLTTGTNVAIAGVTQISGLPPTNVFTQGTPKVYTVTAADASTATYNVNVSVTAINPGPAGSAVFLGLADTYGMISTDAMTLTVGIPPPHIYGNVALIESDALVGFAEVGNPPTSIYVDGPTATPITTNARGTAANIASLPQLKLDLEAAYVNNKLGSTRTPPAVVLTVPPVEPSAGGTFPAAVTDLSGMLLGPGIYTVASTYALGGAGPLVLDAYGNADAVFIFQATDITTTTGSVVLQGGAKAKNVFWVMTNTATIGTNTFFQGTIIAGKSITVNGNANVEGRMLAGADILAAAGTGNITVSGVISVPQ